MSVNIFSVSEGILYIIFKVLEMLLCCSVQGWNLLVINGGLYQTKRHYIPLGTMSKELQNS